MLNLWFIFSEKFSKLSIREQYLILLSGVVILFLFFNSFVFDNEQLKVERINRSLSQLKNDLESLFRLTEPRGRQAAGLALYKNKDILTKGTIELEIRDREKHKKPLINSKSYEINGMNVSGK